MRHWRIAPLAVAAAGATLLATAGVAIAEPQSAGRTYFVDCSEDGPGTGSQQRPYTSLTQINERELAPGDRVLFARGVRCVGTFAPTGTGTASNPVRIGAYGSGDARPIIDGNGAPDTVLIRNMQGIELRDLEVTNAANPGTKRRGVHVQLQDFGVGRHYVLENLHIHHIWGDDTKDSNGSEGILFSVVGGQVVTKFDHVRVLRNTVEHVDRGGIRVVASSWGHRAEVGSTEITRPWTPQTDVLIAGNTVRDVGGDGIVIHTSEGAIAEHNRVEGFQRRSAGYNAGMWAWNSDNSVFRYNDVSGGETTRDGMAFDSDQGTSSTVFEYNYSHDNDGGFMLFCTFEGQVKDVVVRYNISQDDAFRGLEMCPGPIESAHIYNNTIYVGAHRSMTVINENTTQPHNVRFENNIVISAAEGNATMRLQPGSSVRLSHNTMVNVSGTYDNPNGSTADPLLVDPGNAGAIGDLEGYHLRAGSPALGAGLSIPDNGGYDLFGNPVGDPPNMGAYAGSGR